ncbi:BrnA antitoxin family protein [Brenneria tiliae]
MAYLFVTARRVFNPSPTSWAVWLRLDDEVLDAFRATGKG